jgi:hypothetical protein
MGRKRDREPPAPTPLDEVMSRVFLESSPWIQKRIKDLGLKGQFVKGWKPPIIKAPRLES